MNRRLFTLALCQALFLVNNIIFVVVNGLVGLALAPQAWMATLPITAYVAGGALATGIVAGHQRRWGRRRAFQQGLLVAFVSTLVCVVAVYNKSFMLLLVGTVFAGYYSANASLYRFAAAELVQPSYKEKAVSWVLAGGILGGVIGPNLATFTRDILPVQFAGAYVALAVVALVSLALVSSIDFPPLPGQGDAKASTEGRTVRQLLREPLFVAAVACSAIGYGVMNLLMAASPIAMAQCGHPFSSAALVLEWHVIGMYVPSFFTGNLIKRYGVMPILVAGVVLNAACIAFALSGQDVMHFIGALFVLGVGWNFLYIGGTTLAVQALAPHEKTRGQGTIDFCVYGTMTLTSFASGALVTTGGWQAMNGGSMVPLALLIVILGWVALQRRRAANPA
ncbi:MAG: MFS transporter [Aquabacterium sp.]